MGLKDQKIIKKSFGNFIRAFIQFILIIINMELTTVLFFFSFPFVLLTAYFGTKSNFYESDNYKGDGCAHDVKR